MKINDEQVEKLLKESWSAPPPEGMRERILRRASADALSARPRRIPVLKAAFAALAIGIIVFGNVSDAARQARIARVSGISVPVSDSASMAMFLRQRSALQGIGIPDEEGRRPL